MTHRRETGRTVGTEGQRWDSTTLRVNSGTDTTTTSLSTRELTTPSTVTGVLERERPLPPVGISQGSDQGVGGLRRTQEDRTEGGDGVPSGNL